MPGGRFPLKIVPVLGEATRWWVWSETRPGVVYIVDSQWQDLDAAPAAGGGPCQPVGYGCACERFLADNMECKHIKAVKKKLKR